MGCVSRKVRTALNGTLPNIKMSQLLQAQHGSRPLVWKRSGEKSQNSVGRCRGLQDFGPGQALARPSQARADQARPGEARPGLAQSRLARWARQGQRHGRAGPAGQGWGQPGLGPASAGPGPGHARLGDFWTPGASINLSVVHCMIFLADCNKISNFMS